MKKAAENLSLELFRKIGNKSMILYSNIYKIQINVINSNMIFKNI